MDGHRIIIGLDTGVLTVEDIRYLEELAIQAHEYARAQTINRRFPKVPRRSKRIRIRRQIDRKSS